MAVFLNPDKVRNEYGLEIKEKIIPDGNKNKPNRRLTSGRPEWVTVHNTDRVITAAGTKATAVYIGSTRVL